MRKTLVLALLGLAGSSFAQLYNNATNWGLSGFGLSTGATAGNGTAAPTGTTWSEDQAEAGVANTNAGFGCQISAGNRMADDFTVTGAGWNVTSIDLFSYQTGGSPTGDTINDIRLQIWNGRPGDSGASVVWGDLTTNIRNSGTFTNMYRIFNTTIGGSATGTTRPLYMENANVSVFLAPGTYWLDWQLGGSLSSGPWAPMLTPLNLRTMPGWNGRQFTSTGWADAIDLGVINLAAQNVPAQQEFPFVINGSPVPEPASMAVLGLGALALIRKRRSKKA